MPKRLKPAQPTLLLALLFITLAFTTGCEENPITEGLLKASPPDDNRNGGGNNQGDSQEREDELMFEGVFDGETGAAFIDGDDDALTMAVNSYRLWHLQQVPRSLDRLVRELVVNGDIETAQIWDGAFGGSNCGDNNAVTLTNNGESGLAVFDDFCVTGVPRSDNFPFTLNGEVQWQNAAPPGNERPASRTVSFDNLRVEWRGETYRLTGRSILSEDGNFYLGGLDVRRVEDGREWRLLTERLLNATGNTGTPDSYQLFAGNLGSMTMTVDSNWVRGANDCPQGRGATIGQANLASGDNDNPAFFRMELGNCDQFNIIGDGERSAADSRERDLRSGPYNLSDKL